MKFVLEGQYLGMQSNEIIKDGQKTVYTDAVVLVDGMETVRVSIEPHQLTEVAQYAHMSNLRWWVDVRSFNGRSGAFIRVRLSDIESPLQ
ncbi:hypothetical protein [Alicyclobacillus tolerans]|uniref:Uncharacterized protein n=1 Tax=Alicyclobacillus tolerans TaxID=90970 RepID=A0A1M6MKA3_9BACL|nr:hypothetical protein [Alicyclobacillus montanus]SHJ83925.1 hypothetical protein SAMN05443507_10494 [Alicyclobacillus montanus]